MLHKRVHNVKEARRSHGDKIDRLSGYLGHCDPLADELVSFLNKSPEHWKTFSKMLEGGLSEVSDCPEPLRAFFLAAEQVPVWVDWERMQKDSL